MPQHAPSWKGLLVSLAASLFALIASPVVGFDNTQACADQRRYTIVAAGDVLLHARLQRHAFAHPLGYRSLWAELEPFIQAADLAYANLEGPMAAGLARGGYPVADPGKRFDDRVYTSFPAFNYHPSLATDLKAAGFDLVSTANNHALDRLSAGVDATISTLEQAGLAYTGTRRKANPGGAFHTLVRSKGVTTAWLACSYSTNGFPDPYDQMLHCYKDEAKLLATIEQLAQSQAVDAVIVTPHWGLEYQHAATAQDKRLGQAMLDAGATVVVGTHPHVVQPWYDGTNSTGEPTLIMASTGNFVSNQRKLPRRSGIVVQMALCPAKTPASQRQHWILAQAAYVPTLMTFDGGVPRLRLNAQPSRSDGRASLQLTQRLLGSERMRHSPQSLEKGSPLGPDKSARVALAAFWESDEQASNRRRPSSGIEILIPAQQPPTRVLRQTVTSDTGPWRALRP